MLKVTNKAVSPVEVFCGGKRVPIAPGEFLESDDFTETEEGFVRAYPHAFAVEGRGTALAGDATDAETAVNAAMEKVREAAGAREEESALEAVTGLAEFHSTLAPIAERLHVGRDGFVDAVTKALDEGDKFRQNLADIVALFGTEEVDELNVKAAVERLIQDQKAASAANDGGSTNDQPTDLAAAVALLDDANDDHWTQAGKPDIAALKALTGGDVTRAQVDALPTQRERVKPTA